MELHLSGSKFTAPTSCACCSLAAESTLAVAPALAFPYCRSCLAHVAAWPDEKPSVLSVLTFGFSRNSAKARARALCSGKCVGPEAAVAVVGVNGTVTTLEMKNERFAMAFAAANRAVLVNLDWAISQQLDLMAPRAVAVVDPAYARALESLEKAIGPASRRTALERALKELKGEAMQERLLLEASRIEVEAVLAKAEGQASDEDKRRVLEAALAEIKKDTVADALQAKQVQWLEDAIGALTLPEPR